MSLDLTPGTHSAPVDDESIPWILRRAAERRGEVLPTNGQAGANSVAADDRDEADEPAGEAPLSRFRRVSGTQTVQAATPVRPVATGAGLVASPELASRARTYAPPSPRNWDAEVDDLGPSTPTWTPPPSRPMAPPPEPVYYPPAPKKTSLGLVVACVVGGLLLAGAGIGGALYLIGDSAPSRAEFVSTADGLCRPANGPVAAIVKPVTYPELAASASTLNTTIGSQLGQLQALELPGGAAKAQVTGVFTAMRGTGAASQRLQDAAGRSDDAATIAASKDMASQASDARTKASAAGFSACAIGLQPGVDATFAGTQSIIKAGFVAQADVLCRRAATALEDITIGGDTGRAIAASIGRYAGTFEGLTSDIRALPVAPGDEATVNEMLAALDKLNAKNREAQDAAARLDLDRLEVLEAEEAPLVTAVDSKLDAYGIGSCGSNFGF